MPQRSHTPVKFSRSDVSAIREMLRTGDKPALCPRCTDRLKVDGPVANGGPLDGCFHVRCQACRRTAFITKTRPARSFNLY
jgi:hypothetical protein